MAVGKIAYLWTTTPRPNTHAMRSDKTTTEHWLNVLPMFANHLDLTRLEEGEVLLRQLLAGTLRQVVTVDEDTDRLLASICFEGKNYRRLAGMHSLAVGYPFVYTSAAHELVSAPLCLWQVRLEPGPVARQWQLIRTPDMPVLWNRPLLELIETGWQVKVPEGLQTQALTGQLPVASLKQWVDELCTTTHWQNRLEGELIAPFPGVEHLGEQTQHGSVWPAAVLGHFPPPLPPLPQAAPERAFAFDACPPPEVALHPGAVSPAQASASWVCTRNRVSAISCVRHDERLGWLAVLVGRYFLSGKRCLVVSERTPTLRSLQAQLHQLGLSTEVLMLTDPWNDRQLLRDTARMALRAALEKPVSPPDKEALIQARRVSQRRARIEAAWRAAKKAVFGGLNWTDTVGLFLRYQQRGGKELLNPQLAPEGFAFTHAEFEQLLRAVREGYPRFEAVGTLQHPLLQLHPRFFDNPQPQAARAEAQRLLSRFAERLHQLNTDYIRLMDEWAGELENWYQQKARDLDQALTDIEAELSEMEALYGKAFGRHQLLPALSSRARKQRSASKALVEKFRRLQARWPDWPEIQPPEPVAVHDIATLRTALQQYRARLDTWRPRIAALVHEHLQRLNSQNVPDGFAFAKKVSAREEALEHLIADLNEARLLEEQVAHQMLTIPRKRAWIETLLARLEDLQRSLRDFDTFHAWQHYLQQASETARKTLEALARVRPDNPEATFASWYLHQVLTRNCQPDLPDGDVLGTLERPEEVRLALDLYFRQAQYQRQVALKEALKQLQRQDRALYRYLTARKAPSEAWPVARLLCGHAPFWTTLFPVMLLTPAVAATLRAHDPDFQADLLVIDEANRMPATLGAALHPLGRQMVASGSAHHLTHTPSLLQWLQSNGAARYRILPSKPEHFQPWYQPPRYWHARFTDGRYDARSDANEQEAMQVLRQLLKVKPRPDRIFPSVGIICFTRAQRDLIQMQLLRMRQHHQPGSETLEQLERNGLMVLACDELYGMQFDLLLVSLTFGQVNASGAVTRRIATFDEPEPCEALKAIARCQAESIIWMHSIPEHRLEAMADDDTTPGQQLLARLLQLTHHIEQDNQDACRRLATQIGLPLKWPEKGGTFTREVAHILQAWLPPRRFAFDKRQGDYVLHLCVTPTLENAPPHVLVPDGLVADTLMISPEWERAAWMKMKQQGMDPTPLWSVRWWKDYPTEARKLASQILKRDQQLRRQPPAEKAADKKIRHGE